MIQAVWANVAPRAALAPPSPEAKRLLSCKSIDPDDYSGGDMRSGRGSKAATECFRIDANGKVVDTQYRLVARGAYAARSRGDRRYDYYDDSGRSYWSPDPWRGAQQWGSRWDNGQRWDYGQQRWREEREWRSPQRVDPTYFWGGGRRAW